MEISGGIELGGGMRDPEHERKLSVLGAQVTRVAHELNTPVSLIAGSLANLDQQVGALLHYVSISQAYTKDHPDLARAYRETRLDYVLANANNLLAICDEGVQRLSHLVGQLRRYGRRDPLDASERSVGLAEILRSAERLARSTHPGAPPVEWDLVDTPRVHGDAQALVPAFANIIGNAFDAVAGRPRPCVSVAVRCDDADWVEVRVVDNGPGIPPTIRNRIFEPFFTTKAAGAGVGLGLAIAKESIDEAGGSLHLGERADGAELVVRLPAVSV